MIETKLSSSSSSDDDDDDDSKYDARVKAAINKRQRTNEEVIVWNLRMS